MNRKPTLPSRRIFQCLLTGIFCLLVTGCPMNRLPYLLVSRTQDCVLDPDISKDALVEHLNTNVLGTETSPGLSGWKTYDAKVRIVGSGIPIGFSTSVAVQAPRNLRISVAKPGGGQAVDIGSNEERFWFWTYEQPELVTCCHEETSMALHRMRLPVPIDPDWLMEIFGVMPIDGEDYVLDRPSETNPIIDLIAVRSSPSGNHTEQIIRVNACTGRIDAHILRQLDGTILAKALLGDYRELPNGSALPTSIRISMPQVDKQLQITLGKIDANPFYGESTLWAMPTMPGSRTVDLGVLSRQAMALPPEREIKTTSGFESKLPRQTLQEPSYVEPEAKIRLQAPVPVSDSADDFGNMPAGEDRTPQFPEEPEWARTQVRRKPILSGGWLPSTYSEGAWQSSSGRPRQGRE